jgi:hypothetical protein
MCYDNMFQGIFLKLPPDPGEKGISLKFVNAPFPAYGKVPLENKDE